MMTPTDRYTYLLKRYLEDLSTPEEYEEFLKLTISDEFDAVLEAEFMAHATKELAVAGLHSGRKCSEDVELREKMFHRFFDHINRS